jgi:hypothetical protein
VAPANAWLDYDNAQKLLAAYEAMRTNHKENGPPPPLVNVTDIFGSEHWICPVYVMSVNEWSPGIRDAAVEWDKAHAIPEKKEWE